MKTKVFESDALYGDHHVLEVRRILLELPGVEDVYASSSFHAIEVTYDPDKINDMEIAVKLDEAGYLGEWSFPIEVGAKPVGESDQKPYFRHTEVFETAKQTVGFSQNVPYSGRPLWPCPGMGILQKQTMEE